MPYVFIKITYFNPVLEGKMVYSQLNRKQDSSGSSQGEFTINIYTGRLKFNFKRSVIFYDIFTAETFVGSNTTQDGNQIKVTNYSLQDISVFSEGKFMIAIHFEIHDRGLKFIGHGFIEMNNADREKANSEQKLGKLSFFPLVIP